MCVYIDTYTDREEGLGEGDVEKRGLFGKSHKELKRKRDNKQPQKLSEKQRHKPHTVCAPVKAAVSSGRLALNTSTYRSPM